MCGIIGFASSYTKVDLSVLKSQLQALKHRGPDFDDVWISSDKTVGLGHSRLAIIDLSSQANQPMHSGDQKIHITFNGEIYNFKSIKNSLQSLHYKFNTESDTEVLIVAYQHWGIHMLNYIQGMFAFCIYDENLQTLIIARDRVGEKPLYYCHQENTFRFASESKALIQHSTQKLIINQNALFNYLTRGYVQGHQSMVENIFKLPPGHYGLYSLRENQFSIRNYWTLPEFDNEQIPKSSEQLVEECTEILDHAVQDQLVSDVPLGVLLSGGVDSSLITAFASRHLPKVKTFTVTFPQYAKFDESRHAKLIADYFNTEHHVLAVDRITCDIIPQLAIQYDDPLCDTSMIPTFLVSQLIRQHCTVAVGGDGGDELFGGYSHYDRMIKVAQTTKYIPGGLKKLVSKTTQYLPLGFKGRTWLTNLNTNFDKEIPLIASIFDEHNLKRLLINPLEAFLGQTNPISSTIHHRQDLLQRATRMDFMNYLPEDILVKVDRASMLKSLEIRAPLLDVKMIEFAFSQVPSHLKASSTLKKILLKKIAAKILPSEFDLTRKQGFSIPISEWLRQAEWNTFMKDILYSKEQDIFDKKYLQQIIKNHEKGADNGNRIYGLILFTLWKNHYHLSL